jgi:hypothetical protein
LESKKSDEIAKRQKRKRKEIKKESLQHVVDYSTDVFNTSMNQSFIALASSDSFSGFFYKPIWGSML